MELTAYQNYAQFKNELDYEIRREAEGFVKIGYLLRVAQDSDILSESQYENVNDFAKAEYGLDKSQVSRFMAINERFSVGGYSERLESQYAGFGVAKLAIMLQLPDAVNDQLTSDMSKADINAIKEEYKEEQKISDIEVMLEPKSADPLLTQIMHNILHEHPDIYEQIWHENKKAEEMGIRCESKDYAEDILAAAGEAVFTTRVEGVGKLMLTIRAGKEKLIITNMRTGEITEPDWEELGKTLWFVPTWRDPELEWVDRYQDEWPIKSKPAEKKEEKKPLKVVTTPKKEEKAWGVDKKEPEKPINTQCDGNLNDEKAGQQAEETKIIENVDFTQSDSFMNKPIEEAEIEPLEEEIEEIDEEIPKVAPVQQAENVDFTQCETISAGNDSKAEPMVTQKEENAPHVETKTMIQMKDEIVKTLGEVIGFVYESKWFDVQSTLEKVDFMIKGCISEEISQEDEDEDEEW